MDWDYFMSGEVSFGLEWTEIIQRLESDHPESVIGSLKECTEITRTVHVLGSKKGIQRDDIEQ